MKGKAIFVTGIGTGIGKTVSSAVLTEALGADYWKPIQSGLEEETDTEAIRRLISNKESRLHEELYSLATPASPHLAARIDNVHISIGEIADAFESIRRPDRHLIIEGAGGLMVPLNEKDFYPDLLKTLRLPTVVVSSQYLGNINHSMLTAQVLHTREIPVIGWIFNGTYHINEEDIIRWSNIPKIGRIEKEDELTPEIIKRYAEKIKPRLMDLLEAL